MEAKDKKTTLTDKLILFGIVAAIIGGLTWAVRNESANTRTWLADPHMSDVYHMRSEGKQGGYGYYYAIVFKLSTDSVYLHPAKLMYDKSNGGDESDMKDENNIAKHLEIVLAKSYLPAAFENGEIQRVARD